MQGMAAGSDLRLVEIARGLVPLAADGCSIDLAGAEGVVCVAASHVDPAAERALYTTDARDAQQAQARCAILRDGAVVGEFTAWSSRPLVPLAEALVCSAADHVGAVLEARAERARADLADAARTSLASMVGHEVRAPLQTLTMGLELVRMRIHDSADELPRDWLIDRLARLDRSVARLTSVAARLLDVSRHEAGTLRLSSAEENARAVVEAVVARVRDEAEWADSRIDVSTDGELQGRWDRLHLETIIENLLTNALKYGAGRPVEVRVTGDAKDVRFEVRDQGCGILREDQPHVFGRFFRGTVPGLHAGLGLGLWIVERLVEAHGGSISCESELGHGTTFQVRLPRDLTRPTSLVAPSGAPLVEPER